MALVSKYWYKYSLLSIIVKTITSVGWSCEWQLMWARLVALLVSNEIWLFKLLKAKVQFFMFSICLALSVFQGLSSYAF